MHIKICNVTKSIGVDMAMVNLAGIDNMMTNFNQIVIQEGIINKYFKTTGEGGDKMSYLSC